jgi:glycosyltransferase involved in cell wall biosynthesis
MTADAAGTGAPDITVLLPTYNRCRVLRAALGSVLEQRTGDAFTYEVLVVDDGSTDETRQVVAEMAAAAPVPVRYLRADGEGVGTARNRGIRAARGDWIAFTDDDQVVEPDWLAELMAAARRTGADAVGGIRLLQLAPDRGADVPPGCRAYLGEMVVEAEAPVRARRDLPDTGNSLVARHVFERAGWFPARAPFGGSDLDFFQHVHECGLSIWRTPRAVVHHLIPPYRLEPDYLKWIARRVGVNFARVDGERLGRAGAALIAVARAGRALMRDLPRVLWGRLRGHGSRRIGHECALATAEAYVRQALFALAPGLLRQERFFAGLLMRQESATFAPPSTSAKAGAASSGAGAGATCPCACSEPP